MQKPSRQTGIFLHLFTRGDLIWCIQWKCPTLWQDSDAWLWCSCVDNTFFEFIFVHAQTPPFGQKLDITTLLIDANTNERLIGCQRHLFVIQTMRFVTPSSTSLRLVFVFQQNLSKKRKPITHYFIRRLFLFLLWSAFYKTTKKVPSKLQNDKR